MIFRKTFKDHTQERDDGRNVDPRVGTLSGEGAQQQIQKLEPAFPSALESTHVDPVHATVAADAPSYYGRPMVNEPVWIWTIPVYFYVGGVTGACATLAGAAQLSKDESLQPLIHKLRWVTVAGAGLSGALLISDLGRPSRFYNMLRVFRPTSPMNVGSWLLTAMSGLAGVAALASLGPKPLRPLANATGLGAAAFALPFTGYTAVLINNTAIPFWQSTRRSLPALFTASSMSSAAAVMEFMALSQPARRVVRRFGLIGRIAELGAEVAVEKEPRTPEVRRALTEGGAEKMWRAGKALSLASLALALTPARYRRLHLASAVLATAGVLTKKWAVYAAGRPSARNPRATIEMQRQGHGAAEVGTGSSNLVQLKIEGRPHEPKALPST